MPNTMLNAVTLAARYLTDHPDSTLTKHAICCLLRRGCVPCVHAGNRRFYSYERFLQFLEDGNDQREAIDYGTIRRID